MSITVIMHHYVSTCFLSLVIMSKQVVPSAAAQCIIVKFLAIENVKPAQIMKRW